MDYFKELLDSYSKLKKRTFKLEYLNEQEEVEGRGDPTAAKAFFDAADPQRDPAKFDIAIQSKQPYAYQKAPPKEGGIGKTIVTGGPLGTGYTKEAGSWEELLQVDPKNATKLINFFDQQSVEGEAQTSEQAEADRQAALDTPGSIMDQDEARFPKGDADAEELKATLTATSEKLQELCDQNIFGGQEWTVEGGEKYNICGQRGWPAGRYIGGTTNRSLEYKLVNGITIQINENGKMEPGNIDTELLAEVAKSNEFMVKLLGKNPQDWTEDDCVLARRKIRPTSAKDKCIIFGEDDVGPEPQMLFGGGAEQEEELEQWQDATPSRGIAVTKGPLQRAMIQKIQANCGDLKEVKPEGTASYNEVKGVFNEAFLGWLISVRALLEGAGDDPQLQAAAQSQAIESLQEVVGTQVAELSHLAQSTDPDAGIEMGDLPTIEFAIANLGLLQNNNELKNYLRTMARKNAALINMSGAQSTLGMGRAQTTGGKVDNYLFYGRDKEAAERFAASLDVGQTLPLVTSLTPAQLVAQATEGDVRNSVMATLEAAGFDPADDSTDPITGEPVDPVHLIGLGQKLIEKNKIKVGETLYDRMLKILAGESVTGTAVEGQAYQVKLKEVHPIDAAREAALHEYAEARIAESGLIDAGSTGFQAWVDSGKISAISPTEIVVGIRDNFMAHIPLPGAIKKGQSPIWDTLYEWDPTGGEDKKGEWKERNIEGDSPEAVKNRARVVEATKRVRLMTKIAADRADAKKDGATPAQIAAGQAAEDTLVRMGVQVGMNVGELIQVVIREGEDEDTIAFNQNDLVRELALAQKKERLEIDQKADGQTTTFTFKTESGCDVKYTVNMERRSKTNVAAIMGKINAESAECFQSDDLKERAGYEADRRRAKEEQRKAAEDPEPLDSETIYKFLKGQHQLLEDLLT